MSIAIITQLAIMAVGMTALALLVRRLGRRIRRRSGSPFEAALAPRKESRPELDEFESIRRTVDAARYAALDVHFMLRPLLHELAASRLRVRRGFELDAQPELASGVLGSEAFAFLREGRPARVNYRRPAMSLREIERIVKVLESI
ncbi:MAG TPA: hypothetical protein VHK65_07000 [Candidatus Dormibacteraeota bacterium]|nr:hypothetical protein [Candidatus Dormibacteraeota bacterium]